MEIWGIQIPIDYVVVGGAVLTVVVALLASYAYRVWTNVCRRRLTARDDDLAFEAALRIALTGGRTKRALVVLNCVTTILALLPAAGAVVALISDHSDLALQLDVVSLVVLIVTKGGLWLLTVALIPYYGKRAGLRAAPPDFTQRVLSAVRTNQEEHQLSGQQSQTTATAEQATQTSACPHSEAVGKRWGDPISEERQAELQSYLDRWEAETDHGERKGPFDLRSGRQRVPSPFDLGPGVPLTGADVSWLAERSRRNSFREVPNLHLEGTNFRGAHLEGANLSAAHLEGTYLNDAHLEDAKLASVHLEGANLYRAHLGRAFLREARLEGADLGEAHLEGAFLIWAHLEGADLRNAWMDKATALRFAALDRAKLDQLSFDGANLAVVQWETVRLLGDEVKAHATEADDGVRKGRQERLDEYEAAVRAHLQLAAVLRSQGMSEQADRFTYQAQKLQRTRYRLQQRVGQWLFSWMLFLMAGYGYRLGRIIIAYALIVGAFAAAFLASDVVSGQSALSVPQALDALQISLNAIHGRVFFVQFNLDTLQSWVATVESIVGIVVEGVFVAMLIQRFFGR
jgi:hypothetical protein